MSILSSAMTGTSGERVALTDVTVDAVLRDLLCEVDVAQTYRNDEAVSIEAVYTFPLPLDATLLELSVEIGGRVLQGVVVEKSDAEQDYEDAVADGDAAVMLEAIEPGLYTMNVGNLLPGEQAKICFRYALLYRWSGDRLRFFLPTTIAPRYGESPHRPHQAPEASLTVENRFALKVEILGSLRDAQFSCPTHPVSLVKGGESTVISLDAVRAVMDRDFVLDVRAPQAPRGFAWCDADGDGAAAIASFQPFFPGLRQPRALDIAIVVDCSGSMAGDSIAQAKQALDGILDGLTPEDRMTLIAFGSTASALADRLLACNASNLAKARRFARRLDATMGGTEIGQALDRAYAALRESDAADVFLVTDGEVSDWQAVVDVAKESGRRVFTVGVGSAVSEAFVRGLASATGGECELVSPREGMAERVVRHFDRMRAPRARRVSIRWPEGACDLAPVQLPAVFEGDTVVASARFDRLPAGGHAVLEIESESGEVLRQEIAIATVAATLAPDSSSTVARLAASMRLADLPESAARDTAVRYRLVSRWTNWLVVAERAEADKALEMPALRKVPQTLQAGWGGTGSVDAVMCMSVPSSPIAMSVSAPDIDDFAACYEQVERSVTRPDVDVPRPYIRLVRLITDDPSRLKPGSALDLLRDAGLADDFDHLFRCADDAGLEVPAIAAIVLAQILGGPTGASLPPDAARRLADLQAYAKRALDAIEDLRRRAEAMHRALVASGKCGVLGHEAEHRLGAALGPTMRLDGVLHRLREAEHRSNEHLLPDWLERA